MRSNHSIQDAIESALQSLGPALSRGQLRVECDIEAIASCACSPGLSTAMHRVLQRVAELSPHGGIIEISGIETPFGTEIEIADGAEAFEADAMPAFLCQQRSDHEVSPSIHEPGTNLRVFSTRCPQGGTAWTIVLPRAMSARRVA
ncbi:MAG: hypothetical protein AAF394_01550 [Planctomycetota bacterium]